MTMQASVGDLAFALATRLVFARFSRLSAEIVLSRLEMHHGKRTRRFHQLPLERDRIRFFPLHRVIVRPIDESSPFHGVTPDQLAESDAEFLILLRAMDDTRR